jgi:hypothetical protein
MENYTKQQLETVIDYLTNQLIDMEYTSVAHENDYAREVLLSEVRKIENYLEENKNA